MITITIIGFTTAILLIIFAYLIDPKDLVNRSTYIALIVMCGLIATLCATLLILFSYSQILLL